MDQLQMDPYNKHDRSHIIQDKCQLCPGRLLVNDHCQHKKHHDKCYDIHYLKYIIHCYPLFRHSLSIAVC